MNGLMTPPPLAGAFDGNMNDTTGASYVTALASEPIMPPIVSCNGMNWPP